MSSSTLTESQVDKLLVKKSYELFALLNKAYFSGRLTKPLKIRWKVSLTEHYGHCYWWFRKIEFSVDLHCQSYLDIIDTFLHEMAHMYVDKLGHGKEWKLEAKRLGIQLKAYKSYRAK